MSDSPTIENLASRSTLNGFSKKLFPDETLFHRLARTICDAECLPRKELFEAWEVAKRVRRKMRGGPVYDLAAGHGLLGAIMLILDDSSPTATCVDVRKPASHEKVLAVLEERWPRIQGRITYLEKPLAEVVLPADALTASIHACGTLTDQIIDKALEAQCRVVALPCCHDEKRCHAGPYKGWMDVSLAIDVARVARLEAAGYTVVTQSIPKGITPKNRLIIASPPSA